VILWDEAQPLSWRDQESNAGSSQFGPGVTATAMTIGPDGQPTNGPMSQEAAVRVQAVLGKVFRQGAGQALGEVINQAVGQALGQAAGQALGQWGERQFGQPGGQPMNQPSRQQLGQAGGQPFPPVDPQQFGHGGGQGFPPVDPQAFNQPAGQGFPPVDPQAFNQPAGQAAEWQQEAWSAGQGGPGAVPRGGFNPAQAGQFAPGGEQASALVLGAQEVAGFPAPGGTADLKLLVTRADGSTYTTSTRLGFSTPERRDAMIARDTRLQVWIDPYDPNSVTIDQTTL
jgi:hypothetical protein